MAIHGGLLPLLLLCAVWLGSSAQDQCPSMCHCVLDSFPTIFNCSGRNLKGFPADIIPQINIVDLSNNDILWLPENLEEYEVLQKIYLSNNRIDRISESTFKGLKDLKIIDLSGNNIVSLSRINANTFIQAATSLDILNLSRNNFNLHRNDSRELIKSLTLETLDLSNCSINDISDLNFLDGLPNIKYLNLSQNNIMWISGLKSKTLRHLDVSSCKLDSIHPNALTKLTALEILDISRNRQFSFSRNTFSNSLQILNAKSCFIKLESLQDFPNLTHADLRRNSITITSNNTFNNSKLKQLDLSGNNIGLYRLYPFNNLNNLERLNLAKNSIHHLGWDVFSNNYILKILNLSTNYLDTLVNFSIPSLITLDVSHCNINKVLQYSLRGLTSLLYLNLSDNKIELIPDNLSSQTLEELDLSYCRLTTLTNYTFIEIPELRLLDLRGNRFTTTFQIDIFSNNKNLTNILLTNNPWICNCEAEGFKILHSYLVRRNPNNVAKLVCSSPANYANKRWQEACYEVWYPLPVESSLFQRYGVIVLIVVLTAGGTMIVISAIRRALKERRKERREQQEEEAREQAMDIHVRMIRHHLENLSEDSSPETAPRSRPRRTPSEITQPPTYEEALLMTRSQQDLLDRGVLYEANREQDSNEGTNRVSHEVRPPKLQTSTTHETNQRQNRVDNEDSDDRESDNDSRDEASNSRTLQRQDSVDLSDDSDSATESSRHHNHHRHSS